MAWWKPRIRKADFDPERAQAFSDEADERLAEAHDRTVEIDAVTKSLRQHTKNAFARDVEAAFRRRRAT